VAVKADQRSRRRRSPRGRLDEIPAVCRRANRPLDHEITFAARRHPVTIGYVQAADIRPVDPTAQMQSSADLFLIFVGANVVATTFQVGASLAGSFTPGTMLRLIAVGSIAGAALVAALAPLGSRLRVPSV